jgi:chaperonin cofactor prefoldin
LQDREKVVMKLKGEIEGYQMKIADYDKKMEEIDCKNKDLFTNLNEHISNMSHELKKKTK